VGDGGCTLVHPPAPPTQTDPSDAGDLDLVFAVRTFDLGLTVDGGAPPPIGYDLDGLCTCPGPVDCVPTLTGSPACDEPGGRDNAGGALFNEFFQLSMGSFFSQAGLNTQIANGLTSLLVRVRNYNGTLNDAQVELSVYVSDGTPPGADGGRSTPTWSGADAWIVDGRSVFGASGPPITPVAGAVDSTAYVVDGVVVGSLSDYFVPLQFDENDLLLIEMNAGLVTGTLMPASGGDWTVPDGLVSGRVAASNLMAAFAYVHDPSNTSQYLCPSSSTYPQLQALICPALDITANPTASHAQTCDALSMQFGFAAQSAQFGPVVTAPRVTTCDGGAGHC
jgi:hypothetical protein